MCRLTLISSEQCLLPDLHLRGELTPKSTLRWSAKPQETVRSSFSPESYTRFLKPITTSRYFWIVFTAIFLWEWYVVWTQV